MKCWPWWYEKYKALDDKTVVKSGCPTVNGNVNCNPESMRANAAAQLAAKGLPSDLSLGAYTLARYFTSEVGSGPVTERVAVGEAAVNRAKRWNTDINGLLLYRQGAGHPNRGYYGPIHSGGVTNAPYGRWAATSKDPTVGALLLAQLIISGESDNFAEGADDQVGLQYAESFKDPEATMRRKAADGSYWVGHLPGVDPWHTFLFRDYGVSPDSAEGRALLNRSLEYVRQRKRVGNLWVSTTTVPVPNCTSAGGLRMSPGAIVAAVLGGSALLAGAIYLGRTRAARLAPARLVRG